MSETGWGETGWDERGWDETGWGETGWGETGWGETGVGRVPVPTARAKSEKGSANTVSCITVFQLQSGRYRHFVLTVLPKHRGSRGRRRRTEDGGIFCSLAQALWQLIYQIAKAPPELFNLRDFHSFFQIIIYYFATIPRRYGITRANLWLVQASGRRE